MKRKSSLIVLLCVLSGMIMVGCSKSDDTAPATGSMSTNAPSTNMAAPSTNK